MHIIIKSNGWMQSQLKTWVQIQFYEQIVKIDLNLWILNRIGVYKQKLNVND